jgi:SHS2 domain-containing protein
MYWWVEHTAELELRIEAPTPTRVFEDALVAVGELFDDGEPGEPVTREVTCAATDRPELLAAWIDELVFLAETEDFVPERVRSIMLEGARLFAVTRGRRGKPRHVVKGATYHELAFDCSTHGCRATVVLDV